MWEVEKKRIEKLRWWDEVAGKHGFPADIKVWHVHPLAWVENFGNSERGIDIDLFMENYKKRHGDFKNTSGHKLDTTSEGHLRILIEALVKYFKSYNKEWFAPHVAYILATARHETFWNKVFFESREEGGAVSYFNKYDPFLADTQKRKDRAIAHENTQQGDGYKYRGRGYVQLTWKINYRKCGTHLGIDLVNNPDRANEPDVAAACAVFGMFAGIFTGTKITNHITNNKKDYYNARRVINGTDEADLIKGYAEIFEEILKESE
jgi:hypothetical protein